MGGGILTRGLASPLLSEPRPASSSSPIPPKNPGFGLFLLGCQGPPFVKASHKAMTS